MTKRKSNTPKKKLVAKKSRTKNQLGVLKQQLKTETSLERVREVAMSMRVPDDLLRICEIVFKELRKLGFTDLRNAMINIHNDEKKSFLNYDYSRQGKSITPFQYNAYPVITKLVKNVRKNAKAFTTSFLKEKELDDFKKFREQNGEKTDLALNKAKAIYYYFFSTGTGAIGISSLKKLDKVQTGILERLRDVFKLAYRRYEDIRNAEAQTREAQIEASLERVRSRTMAMQKSEELAEVAVLLFKQVSGLGIKTWTTGFNVWSENGDAYVDYITNPAGGFMEPYTVYATEYPVFKAISVARKTGEEFYVNYEDGKTLIETYRQLTNFANKQFDDILQMGFPFPKCQYEHFVFGSKVSLMFITYDSVPEAHDVFRRFGKVFEQTYTRFLDLQKAEAQAREAQIQLALERVRTKTMMMKKSDELSEAAQLLYGEFRNLNINTFLCGYCFIKEQQHIQTVWVTTPDGTLIPDFIDFPLTGDHVLNERYEDWRQKKPLHIFELAGDQNKEHHRFLSSKVSDQTANEIFSQIPDRIIFYCANFSAGYLFIIAIESLSSEEQDVITRFSKVFEQTYTRFLDLQKAEAQARESQIQLALERVRARTMAMQRSDELPEAANLLFQQVQSLGAPTWTAGYCIFDEDMKAITLSMSRPWGDIQPSFRAPLDENPSFIRYLEAHNKGLELYIEEVSGKALEENYQYLLTLPIVGEQLNSIVADGHALPTYEVDHCAYFSKGFLLFITYQQVPELHDTFKRFASVFDQTYTRFLDLQKAEAQARESQIQLALERVRARTMAMQRSDELAEVAVVLFQQVKSLGVSQWVCGFCIWEIGDTESTWYSGNPDGKINPPAKFPLTEHPVFIAMDESRRRGDELFIFEKSGELQTGHYRYMMSLPVLGDLLRNMLDAGLSIPPFQIDHYANFLHGNLIFITYDHVPEMHDVFKRFAKVFEQTYTRFLDLQKAETQARESQIEAALERVRSRSMAMHNSDELLNVITVVSQELQHLGLKFNTVSFGVNNQEHDYKFWFAAMGDPNPAYVRVPYLSNPMYDRMKDVLASGIDFYADTLTPEESRLWHEHLFVHADLPFLSDETRTYILRSGYARSIAIMSSIMLIVSNYAARPYTETENDIIKRFAAVFQQSYTRFLDLQKAEAQARESQIEAALERVRSRTMAMHKSEELLEVITVVCEQMQHLGIKFGTVSFGKNSASFDMDFWVAAPDLKTPIKIYAPYIDISIYARLKAFFREGKNFFTDTFSADEIRVWYQHVFDHNPSMFSQKSREYLLSRQAMTRSAVLLKNVILFIINHDIVMYSDEENEIFIRFATVFEQAYTRFLDLQKAEAQAREAQIEAALERVRARSLAMHSSVELKEVAMELRKQMGAIAEPELEVCAIHLYEESPEYFESWAAVPVLEEHGKIIQVQAKFPKHGIQIVDEMLAQYRSGMKDYILINEGKKILEWFDQLKEKVPLGYELIMQNLKGTPPEQTIAYWSMADFKGGSLVMTTFTKPKEESRHLLRRFSNVFGMAYMRFVDLQKAEGQAREAQIEAALERVRGKAMAMHSSDDLAATIGAFYRELESLSSTPRRCGVGLLDKQTRVAELSTMNTTENGGSIEVIGKLKMEGHPVLEGVFDGWVSQKEYHPVLRGNEIKEYYQLLRPQVAFPDYPQDVVQYGYFFFFPEGGVYAWTEKELSEDELKIYRRFTSVMSLTYRRYKDLKDAEARALNAVREASLDRVRAEIASMRTAEDLQLITPLVWRELVALGVPFFRCGVFIVDEQKETIHFYLSNPEGKPLAVLHQSFNSLDVVKKATDHWRIQKVYTDHWDKAQFVAFTKSMIEQGQIQTATTYQGGDEPPDSLTLQFVPFAQGMMYVGSAQPLSDSQIELVQGLAEAFSVAYSRYEDFIKLETAKLQVEDTLKDLRATQTQLIQSEKMASLGELTAGIAHEIQNPLNFVNNFSEVSSELIDEMMEEVKKERFAEVQAIANDLKQNLEKINHHGKRADGIVKGMLQHSRNNSGQKELTDLNELCDEYLRLAFHGYRAKDKSFNAKFETDFDSSLEKINIIPQDIGRVVLNLISNAFFTVNEKSKLTTDYEPTVKVITRKVGDKVSISVKDNGNGIPKNMVDKIFQPFFTTKPTGQGTGLGLSLSYDIVKAHGGELRVETKEGEGSEFIIMIPY